MSSTENTISSSTLNQPTRKRSISAKQSRETLSRKHSERHHVMQIQNYIIYRKTIGAGSMGKVKLAECLTDVHKQKYAVKIMPKIDLEALAANKIKSKDPKDTPEEREQRTIREMAIMRLLRHPNICQLKEYITEGDKYYMFLEYVDGGQLLDYIIKHGKLKEKQARKFARQIVSALDYCHRNSIVHRDLKIENILITQSEQLKIIDFGLSNTYSPTQQLNTFCGSLYFAAPELLKAKEYTGPEVDVWSFGVVLYVLVCGKVPFDDTNLPALHEKIKSGVVEEYPDHLGKDCIDLLTKIFVVNPKHRITLSGIKSHPWMNKGYEEPIRNYLPRRQPIDTIDMEIVKGMDGFGLGSAAEIEERLKKIILSPAYQNAATKIDQNFQKKESDDQQLASRPRWRRSLSINRKKPVDQQDDFQSLPAMYDPLISIYYLVKERKESDERKQKLLNAEPNTIGLSRSASTLVVSKQRQQQSNDIFGSDIPIQSGETNLSRRRTYDTSKKLPDLPPIPKQSTSNKVINDQYPPTPIPTASKSERILRPPKLLRKKSLQQAAKKMGFKLPGSQYKIEDEHDKKVSNASISHSEEKKTTESTLSVSNSQRKSNWLKLELNSQSAAKLQQPQQQKVETKIQQRQSTEFSSKSGWKRLSLNRKSTRLSFDNSTGNLHSDPGESDIAKKSNSSTPTTKDKSLPKLVLETSKSEVISNKSKSSVSSVPKSLFQFNRGQLFRMEPEKMKEKILNIISQMNIEVSSTTDPFKLSCIYRENQFSPQTPAFKFYILIYEARWAGGKIGFKLKDHHDNDPSAHLYRKQVLRDLYHLILNDIEKTH